MQKTQGRGIKITLRIGEILITIGSVVLIFQEKYAAASALLLMCTYGEICAISRAVKDMKRD